MVAIMIVRANINLQRVEGGGGGGGAMKSQPH